jgi:hypothetical protein
VGNASWYPNSPLRWDDPGAAASEHSHDSMGGIDKLVEIMEVPRNDVPGGVISREGRDFEALISRTIENRRVTHLRH